MSKDPKPDQFTVEAQYDDDRPAAPGIAAERRIIRRSVSAVRFSWQLSFA
jgi:hypothetical protein